MNYPLDYVLSAQVLIAEAKSTVMDRNTDKFLLLCASRNVFHLIGFMMCLYRDDKEAFDWIMYTLSINKGYEDFICKFWIANWQVDKAQI